MTNEAPQAKVDLAPVSEAGGCGLESHEERHIVIISRPEIKQCQMLLHLNVDDSEVVYPLDSIDNASLRVHILWKFSGDPSRILKAIALVAKQNSTLTFRNWEFV